MKLGFHGVDGIVDRGLEELKYLIRRDAGKSDQHLLETEEYRAQFYPEGLPALADGSVFKVRVAAG